MSHPSREWGRTLEELTVEMLARGLSGRDIEDAFRADDGRLLLSRSAVSELGEQLWRDYWEFATRNLSKHEIVYQGDRGLLPPLGAELRNRPA